MRVDGRAMAARVAKIAVNAMHAPNGGANELPAILRGWFGAEAGRLGRGETVRFGRTGAGLVMEPFFPGARSPSDEAGF